jgi:cold shock CspA family protein
MAALRGTIAKYFDHRGFGFIKPDRAAGDVFFHVENCEGYPSEGANVEYTATASVNSHRPKAKHIRVLGGGDD